MIRVFPTLRAGVDLFLSRFPLMMGALLIVMAVRVGVGLIPEVPYLGTLVRSAVSLILLAPLTVGQSWIALRVVRGEPASIRDLFRGYSRWGTLVGISLMTNITVGVGTLLLIVPGIVWGLALMFAPVAALDAQTPDGSQRKLGVFDALQESQGMTKGIKGALFGISLILGLPMAASLVVTLLSRFAPGVEIPGWVSQLLPLLTGVLFMGPIGATSFMIIYDKIAGLARQAYEDSSGDDSSAFDVELPTNE